MVKKHLSRLLAGLMSFIMAFSVAPATVNSEAAAKQQSEFATVQEIIESNMKSMATYSDDEVVEFIVELEGKPLLETKSKKVSLDAYLDSSKGAKALNQIEKEQASVKKQIQKNRVAGMQIEYTYTLVMNGFSVRAPYSEKENLESMDGVKSVFVAQTHEYVEPVSGYTKVVHTSGAMMDSDKANEEGYTGKGTVTAVLDTGLDVNHSAFANAPEDPRYTKSNVEEALETGLNASATAEDLYKSEKIPFAYDYADKDTDVSDSQGHGTHVSGSVGADCEELTGVAPDTQVMAMKVFSDASSGASDTWIVAALEDCVRLGVDTINMSLGTGAGFSKEADEAISSAYERVEAQGINLMCAAGNDTSAAYMNSTGTDMNPITSPDNGVVGSPSTYDAAVSVASINENMVYSEYFKAGDNKITFVDTATEDEDKFINALDGQTVEYVVIPGYGQESDFATVDVEGKVALVARGSIAFTEKESNAQKAGAIAMICFNNVDGEAVNMQSGGLLPMISITKADGKIMRNLENKTITVSKDFAEDIASTVGGQMSDFSSLGVTPDLGLKPEITAPGGNVYSTMPGGTYGNMSGTSMASPHMAGAASVMRQYVNEAFPSYTAVQKQELINNLLMSTAVPVKDTEGVYYTPRKQGSGLAEVYNAIHTGAYLTVNGDRPKAELKDNVDGTFSFTFKIHNISQEALTYDISAAALTAKQETVAGQKYVSESSRVMPNSEFNVEFSENKVTVPAGGEKAITVNMQLTAAGKKKLADFTNGTYLDGFILVTSADEDGIDLSLPYLGFYGDWSKAPIYDATLYEDESAVGFGESAIYLMDIDYSALPLGINYLLDDTTTAIQNADINKIAVASRSLMYQKVYPVLGMLRGAKTVDYKITNAEGQEVFSHTANNVSKSYYYASGGWFTYDMPTEGWQPIYFDEEGYWNYLEDGLYTYTVTASIDGKEDATQSLSFPITIDNQGPELLSHRYYEEDGTSYLEVKVKDNHYMMGMQLVTSDGKSAVSEGVAVESSEEGGEVVYTFDLTTALELGATLGKVAMYDYAMNESYSQIVSFVSQEIEAVSVSINQQQITCNLDSKPFQLTATVSPDDAIDKTITWSSDNEEVVTVAQDGWITLVGPGSAIIRATASNGVYGTTEIVVNDTAKDLPADFVIREDGRYKLPADLSKVVTITENAKDVTVVGDSSKTAESPYKNIGFKSEVAGLNLTIQNVNVSAASSSPVVEFTGEGNVLNLKGSNSMKAEKYYSKALVWVPEDAEATVDGTGTLDLLLDSSTYGAGIGANPGKVSGKININGGTINGTNYGSGALIGGSGYGTGKITINGGVMNVNVPLSTSGWGGNLSTCGAAIGDGNRSGRDGKCEIEINGGEINGTTEVQAAVIGTGHKSSTVASVTINGGKLNLKSVAGNGDASVGGACIGTGDQSVAMSRITINGGEIVAATESGAAAIGGGAGTAGCTVVVNGGTVTVSTTTTVPAIGKGIYISDGSDGALVINGGSLKAISASADVKALPFSNIQNEDYDDVFETVVPASDVKSVVVDGKDYGVLANHPEDNNLYLWMTEGKHQAVVTTEAGTANYQAEVTSTGVTEVKQYFNVNYQLTNLTTDGETVAFVGETYTAFLAADQGYNLPENVEVTMNGETKEVAYDAATGELAVENVTGDLTITAEASKIVIDKEDLVATITDAEKLDEAAYTSDTWKTFAEALKAAKEVKEDENATQTQVNDAKTALATAMQNLVLRGDKTELAVAIAEAEKCVEADYTSGTWTAFAEALKAAKEVNDNVDAVQSEVDAAKETLTTEMQKLIRRGDKKALKELVAQAEALKEDDYTTDSWKALQEALKAAKAAVDAEDALQAEVDQAADALLTALDTMVKRGDKTELKKEVEVAESLDAKAYTEDSWKVFQEAVKAAKAVVDEKDATQEVVDAAVKALQEAKEALKVVEEEQPEQPGNTEKENVATDEQKQEAKEYLYGCKASYTKDDFASEEDWTAYQEALAELEALLANEELTTEQLQAAMDAVKALVETEEPEQPEQPADTDEPEDTEKPSASDKKDDTVQTGDTTYVMMWVMIFAMAMAVVVMKKKTEK